MLGGGYSFGQVPTADIPRSVFNRSHGHKTTFNAGKLIPFYVDEVLPGDTFTVRASVFARLATPIVPLMDNMYMELFFFLVPNRLLWTNWARCMGERPNPGDSIDFRVPVVTCPVTGWDDGSLFDYFGVPTQVGGVDVTALHARAYNLIWNEWFRDENLQARVPQNMGDGPDAATDYEVLRRGKRHDYFTSCLPWPQKGEAVTLGFGETAPVTITGDGSPSFLNDPQVAASSLYANSNGVGYAGVEVVQNSVRVGRDALSWGNPALTGVADLSDATAATINAIREAFQTQRLIERDARGGTRYTELIRSHFGVVSPDQRLQRPEFLGGGSLPVSVNPVTQTSSTDATSPQGNLAAYGVAAGTNGFTKSFTEHGVLLGLVMVRADLTYQQGLPKMFSRRTRYDFYWPAFAHLGEQAVLNREIFAAGTPADDQVFGYQERWADYRYKPSMVTGGFRSNMGDGMDVWHLAQDFETCPVLGPTFIQEDPPIARVVAVPSEPQFLFDSHIAIKAARPLPTYSVPGLVDHF